VAILLMVMLAPFVIVVAESASRGWIPMFSIKSYDVTQLFMDAVPMFLVLGWALFAALFTAQAFAGDRSTGNESFLLERPVARTVTWRARLAVVTANGLIMLVAGWLIWLIYFNVLGEPKEGTVYSLSGLLLGSGLAVILAVICGGLAATAFLDSPMIAVLAGLLLAALPIGAAVFLGSLSPYAILFRLDHDAFPSPLISLSWMPVGTILPVLLYPAYAAVSWLALCHGEPAGRGSRVRGAKVLVPSIIGVLMLFLILAPIAVRANVNNAMGTGRMFPGPGAGRAVVTGGYLAPGGWLIDTISGERKRFFQVPTTDVVWRGDGRYLAVNEGKTIIRPGTYILELKIVDGETGDDLFAFDFPHSGTVWDIAWIGNRVILSVVDFDAWRRLEKTDRVVEAFQFYLAEEGAAGWKDGTIRELNHGMQLEGMGGKTWRIVSVDPGRAFFVRTVRDVTKVDDRTTMILDERVFISELFLENGSIRLARGMEIPGGSYQAVRHLSLSGSYWTDVSELSPEVKRHLRLFDIVTGEEVPLENTHHAGFTAWLEHDELLWTRTVDDRVLLHRWKPGEGESVLMETEPGERIGLDPSPDRGHALLSVYRRYNRDETEPATMTGTWLYRAGSGVVRPSGLHFKGSASGLYYTRWADRETILWGGGDELYLENLNRPGELVQLE
jgi:ABC-type transport system involved in multi-copper enzyme maturation permease subunit